MLQILVSNFYGFDHAKYRPLWGDKKSELVETIGFVNRSGNKLRKSESVGREKGFVVMKGREMEEECFIDGAKC